MSWKYWSAWGGTIVSYSMAGGDLVVGFSLACVGAVCMGCIDLPWWLLVFAPNRRCRCWVRSLPMSLWPWLRVLHAYTRLVLNNWIEVAGKSLGDSDVDVR